MNYLGIDFGTSGARAIAIDATGHVIDESRCSYLSPHPSADEWRQTLWALLDQLPLTVRQKIAAIAVNGTSATVLLCDRQHQPLVPPLLYNDARGAIPSVAPVTSPAHSRTSSLSKALWWYQNLSTDILNKAYYLVHQADWISSLLHGQLGISDYNNALKLGYIPQTLRYPTWLTALDISPWLPNVIAPGKAIAPIQSSIAQRFGFSSSCIVKAGTTDSIAAFLASGASMQGEAVTSLGSTLVLKLLSPVAINEATSGIYSHRLGQQWLVGGASNTGGAVLRHYFSDTDLRAFSQLINPHQSSGLNYYPLLTIGERFPINDPNLAPRLTPRPTNPTDFLHGLLESMARIEALGYQKLTALGGGCITRIYTAGGGAQNTTWQKIREKILKIPVVSSLYPEAAYGTARLAADLVSCLTAAP